MTRLALPANIESAPAAAQPLLQAVQQQLGMVPNLFRVVANSADSLSGWISLLNALGPDDQLPG